MSTNAQIGAVADLLLHYRRRNRSELAEALGMSGKTLARRLNGTLGWEAEEVAQMAEFFDVGIMAFYNGPDALMAGVGPSTTRQYLVGNAAELLAA